MIIGGLPTLHEPGIVAAGVGTQLAFLGDESEAALQPIVATVEWDKTYYGTKSGEPLNAQRVLEGRQKELDNIAKFKVKQDISLKEARARGLKIVYAKWLDDRKPMEGDPDLVRSRLVATENNLYAREDCTQATPPRKVFRILLSCAASNVAPDGTRRRLIARYDVKVAFFHADSDGKTVVVPPKEQREDGVGWLLLKAMHDTRTASKMFGNFVVDALVGVGHEQVQAAPMTLRHKSYDYSLSVHGDDFVAEGDAPGLDKLDVIMAQNFDVKRLPWIGPSEYGGETTSGQHLGCTISWTSEGFQWEGNIKNVEDLMELMQFDEKTKGAATPSCKETGKGVRSSLDELPARDASYYRTCAGALQYIAQDCLAIKQATCEVMGGMATPLRIHQLRLVRVARYLKTYPGEKWHYCYQPTPTVVDEYCDSDWAWGIVTRRSVSCVVEKWVPARA